MFHRPNYEETSLLESADQAPGRRLSDHETVSGTTVNGWPSVVFGLVLVGAGVGTALLVLGDNSVKRTTLYLSLVACSIFAVCGLALVANGVAGLLRIFSLHQERTKHPDEPWRWDHRWDENGAQDDSVRRLVLWAYRALFFAALMLPFNWLVFLSGQLPWWGMVVFGAVVGIFDLLFVYVAYRFVSLLLQYLRYGVGSIRYASFPFLLGQTLEVDFLPTGRMTGLRELKATLRCVEERFGEFDPDDSDSTTTVVPYELYSDARTATGGALDVRFSFPLPEDGPATSLSEKPPIYWELEIAAEVPGVDYAATFLLPVYSRGSA